MTRRSNALPLILLTAAATLVILIGLAIACAPASPSGQSNTPDSPSTHTPTPKPTKYVRMDSPFSPFLAGQVAKHKAAANRPGFSGQSGSESAELIKVRFDTDGSRYATHNFDNILAFLKEKGVTPSTAVDDPENGVISAELTLDMIIELSEMRGVGKISSKVQPYQGMGVILSAVYSEYEAGLITAEEAAASLSGSSGLYIDVKIWIKNPANSGNTDRVLQFLKDNDITLDPWQIYRPYVENSTTDAVVTFIPWSLVPRLAKLPGVEITHDYSPYGPGGPMHSPGLQQPSGATNPAGAHGATVWNNNMVHGYKGDGITVGIIDYSGFRDLPTHLNSVTVEHLCYNHNPGLASPDRGLALCTNRGGTHGTSVAEAVIAIAPNVKLLISNASKEHLLPTVNWMLGREADVIVHSATYLWDGPGDGTSPFYDTPLKAIDAAVNGTVFNGNTPATDSDGNKIVNPAVWVNAAGNHAKLTWFSRTFSDRNADDRMEFNGDDDCNKIRLRRNHSYYFQLRWDDAWRGTNNNGVGASKDLALQLVMVLPLAKDIEVRDSTQPQNGANEHYPLDYIEFTPRLTFDYCLRVIYEGETPPSWVQLQVHTGAEIDDNLEHNTQYYSMTNPAESANRGMLAVGAANWATPTALEAFSSRGPTVDRRSGLKPDIVGADRGRSAAYQGAWPGTSQAAPHVAGLAALAIEMRRKTGQSDAPADIVKFLQDHALRRSASVPAGTPTPTPGPNNQWGAGFAYLPTLTPVPTRLELPAMPTGLTGTAGVGYITLDWSDAARATSYEVMQWDGRAGDWRTLPFRESHLTHDYTITFNGSGATIRGLDQGAPYAHSVRSKNGYGHSQWTSYIVTTVQESTNNENIGGGAPGQGGAPESPTPTPPAPPQ